MHFDIILFENNHLAFHHKYDVILIAKLLKHAGSKVAIFDIYKEDNVDEIEGIPVIHLSQIGVIPNDRWNKKPKNKVHSFLSIIRFLYQQHCYFKKVLKEITPLADCFYFGSYHEYMSSQLLKIKKTCYTWGLRSSRMSCFWQHFKKNPLLAFRMLYLRNKFKQNAYQKLFVSNNIIRKEFINLGIPENRLIIREERCIENIFETQEDKLNPQCTFLTIGMLRPNKQVDKTIGAFKNPLLVNARLLLIGKADPQYDVFIKKSIDNDKRIIRVSEFLNYDKFNSYIAQSHFVVFADKQQASSVTNGTMLEALINYRPIIAPNYDPYAYYIKKYKIGLLYNPEDIKSYQDAMILATKIGCNLFFPAIREYLKTIQFDKVSNDLYNVMKANK